MTSQIIPVEPFDCIVFGGTGDLAERKLIPALYQRQVAGQLSEPTRILGASRAPMSTDDYRSFARAAISEFVKPAERIDTEIETFLQRLFYISVDAKADTGWHELAAFFADAPESRVRAFYLAVAPALFGDIADKLKQNGLINAKSRIIVEKPLGRDLASAKTLNDIIGNDFAEHQVFRIDHYLGKETVQNLMALRFANSLYEPLWNSAHIDHVQITVAESVGLEGRVGYYNTAGALRDMVQNHLLQLLCLVAMEAPSSMDANAVRDEKLKVLRSLKPITTANAAQMTVRGQYRAGASDSGAVTGYQEELGSPSNTETFVAIKAEISNWRWAGVPFYLRTGKRLAGRMSEIVISFKQVPHSIFSESAGQVFRNELVLRLQPNEGVKQWIMIKDPGPGGMRLKHVPLDMTFADAFQVRNPDAYERLIMDVVRGNQTLFMRRDEVEAAWTWVDPILNAWEETAQPAQGYTSGTWGPSSAIALIERDGRTWHEEDA
jgi:glucose-6-phosphate 1-dehydrogenase